MSQQSKPLFTQDELIALMNESDLLPRWRGAIRADARPLWLQALVGMVALGFVALAGQGINDLAMPKGLEMALLGFYLLACVALLFFTGNRMASAWDVADAAKDLSFEEIRIEIHNMDQEVVAAYVEALRAVGRDLFHMTQDDIERLHRIETEFSVKNTLRPHCERKSMGVAA